MCSFKGYTKTSASVTSSSCLIINYLSLFSNNLLLVFGEGRKLFLEKDVFGESCFWKKLFTFEFLLASISSACLHSPDNYYWAKRKQITHKKHKNIHGGTWKVYLSKKRDGYLGRQKSSSMCCCSLVIGASGELSSHHCQSATWWQRAGHRGVHCGVLRAAAAVHCG